MDPKEIIDMVCEEFGVTHEELSTRTRVQDVRFPRHVAIYLLRQNTVLTLKQIAKLFVSKKGGIMDHSTIIHAHRVIKEQLALNSSLYLTISRMQNRIDEIKMQYIKAMEAERIEKRQRYLKMVERKLDSEYKIPELKVKPIHDRMMSEHEKTINKYL